MTETKGEEKLLKVYPRIQGDLDKFQAPENRRFLQKFAVGKEAKIIYGSWPIMASRSGLMRQLLTDLEADYNPSIPFPILSSTPMDDGKDFGNIWLWMNGITDTEHKVFNGVRDEDDEDKEIQIWIAIPPGGVIDLFSFFKWMDYFQIEDKTLGDYWSRALKDEFSDGMYSRSDEGGRRPIKIPPEDVVEFKGIVSKLRSKPLKGANSIHFKIEWMLMHNTWNAEDDEELAEEEKEQAEKGAKLKEEVVTVEPLE